jgi:hypothetical protein
MNELLRVATPELARFLNDNLPGLSADWWQRRVFQRLTTQQQRMVQGRRLNNLQQLDFAALLRVFDQNWFDLANALTLPPVGRAWVRELQDVRNRWAHLPADGVPNEDVSRDADTLRRFLKMIGATPASLPVLSPGKTADFLPKEPRSVTMRPGPTSSTRSARAITKREAVERANRASHGVRLNNRNTTFANINSAVDVWWLDIPLERIAASARDDIHILLYDHRSETLHHLKVPNDYFRENLSAMVVRSDTNRISLHLVAEDGPRLFQDVRPGGGGVRFAQFRQGQSVGPSHATEIRLAR